MMYSDGELDRFMLWGTLSLATLMVGILPKEIGLEVVRHFFMGLEFSRHLF